MQRGRGERGGERGVGGEGERRGKQGDRDFGQWPAGQVGEEMVVFNSVSSIRHYAYYI